LPQFRVDSLQYIKTNLSFELGTVLASFLGHESLDSGLDLTIRPVQLSGFTSARAFWSDLTRPHTAG